MPRPDTRGMLAFLCSELLVGSLVGCGGHRVTLPEVKPPSQVFEPLQDELKKSYLTLFEAASKLQYGDSQILRMQQYLKQAQDYCVGRFEGVSSEYERRVEESQKALKKSSVTDEERHNLHCRIRAGTQKPGGCDFTACHSRRL